LFDTLNRFRRKGMMVAFLLFNDVIFVVLARFPDEQKLASKSPTESAPKKMNMHGNSLSKRKLFIH